MPNQITATISRTAPEQKTELQVRWGWLGIWAFLSLFAAFEVAKHGIVNGSLLYALALTATAVGSFIAPDLTFLVGAGDNVEKGSISTRAVPFYNFAHRMALAFAFTAAVAIDLVPLGVAGSIGGLSWMSHIAVDRALGYGLRNPDGSRDQH